MRFVYRLHAVQRMFERDIEEREVEDVVRSGEVIESYEDDKPYPSFLGMKHIGEKVIHVVYAKDDEENVIVITIYEPDAGVWEDDFKTRRNKL